MKDTVANHLVRYLEKRGVRHVFGLCGHTNIAVLSAMASSSIDFINVRHEQVAAHAADGYARVTRKASVVLTHLGPGLTNAATGVANAALDCIPMVVIAGDVPSHYFGLEQIIEIGPMSGKSNVIFWLERKGMPASDELVDRIFQKAKASDRCLTEEEILACCQKASAHT